MTSFPKWVDYDHRKVGEYLHNVYPKNFFSFILDMGARGTKHPWHPHLMGTANPKTQIIAFEPHHPYDKEIASKVAEHNLGNVKISDDALGTGGDIEFPSRGVIQSKSLLDIFRDHSLDPSARWSFKCDIEGGEDCLLEDPDALELLKQCSHIGMELHFPELKNHNVFTSGRSFVSSSKWEEWFIQNFSETHYILETAHPKCRAIGLATVVLVSKDMIQQHPNLYVSSVWNDIGNE